MLSSNALLYVLAIWAWEWVWCQLVPMDPPYYPARMFMLVLGLVLLLIVTVGPMIHH